MIADLSGLTETQLRLLHSLAEKPRVPMLSESQDAAVLRRLRLIDCRTPRASLKAMRLLLAREREALRVAECALSELHKQLLWSGMRLA